MATVKSKKADVSSVSTSPTALTSAVYSLRWPIYVFNSVVNTQLPAILSHRRSTTVSQETYPLLQFLSLVLRITGIAEIVGKKFRDECVIIETTLWRSQQLRPFFSVTRSPGGYIKFRLET